MTICNVSVTTHNVYDPAFQDNQDGVGNHDNKDWVYQRTRMGWATRTTIRLVDNGQPGWGGSETRVLATDTR